MAGPSKRDREKLRSRVKTELRKRGRSQKDLEASLGLASGTLTRVFGGRRKLDQELAEGIASQLGMPMEELFRATTYARVLDCTVEVVPAQAASSEAAEGSEEEGPVAAEQEAPASEEAPPEQEGSASEEAVAEEEASEPVAASEAAGEEEAPEPSEAPSTKGAPEPSEAPSAEGAPEPSEAPGAEGAPAPSASARPTPPPPEEPRFRKRDIPLKVVRFVLGLVFGD